MDFELNKKNQIISVTGGFACCGTINPNNNQILIYNILEKKQYVLDL